MTESAFFAVNEYAPLVSVCMRLPGAVPYDPSRRRSAVLERQKRHYDWDVYDGQAARSELVGLRARLVEASIRVVMMDDAENHPVQHFPRDLGFVIGNTLFVGRLKSAIRRGEIAGLIRLFEGRIDVHELDAGTIEGGDVMLDDGVIYVGLSEETSAFGVGALERALSARGLCFEVVPISFGHEGVLHLDTVFNIVAPGVALVRRSAFAPRELRRFEARFDLIAMSEVESRRVEVNTLSIDQKTVLIRKGSERLGREILRRNLTPIEVELSEVCKMPGGLRCCTLPLQRAPLVQNAEAKR